MGWINDLMDWRSGVRGRQSERVHRVAVMMLSLFLLVRPASAMTGIRDLDEQAIAVKAPNKVFTSDIVRAGNRLVAVGEHGVIAYSDDNGAAWQQSSVPVSVLLTSAVFADPLDGWAVGHYGIILHTADGGVTWQQQLDGLQENQLALQAAQAAVASNDPSPGTPHAIYRANAFIAAGPDKPFLSILVRDRLHATAFGAYRMVAKTSDGGATWRDSSLSIGDPFSHNLYGAGQAGGKICVAAEAGGLYCSSDGGGSFPAVTPPVSATLFGVMGDGAGGIFTYGVAGLAFHSGDDGASWTPVNVGTGANLTSAIMLSSGDILVAAEDGTIYMSRDNAHSFQRLAFVAPMLLAAAVQAANGDILLGGSNGIITIPARALILN